MKRVPPGKDFQRLAAYLTRFGPGPGLDRERLLEIRLRIASGFYDRRGVYLTSAEKILQAGDVSANAQGATNT